MSRVIRPFGFATVTVIDAAAHATVDTNYAVVADGTVVHRRTTIDAATQTKSRACVVAADGATAHR